VIRPNLARRFPGRAANVKRGSASGATRWQPANDDRCPLRGTQSTPAPPGAAPTTPSPTRPRPGAAHRWIRSAVFQLLLIFDASGANWRLRHRNPSVAPSNRPSLPPPQHTARGQFDSRDLPCESPLVNIYQRDFLLRDRFALCQSSASNWNIINMRPRGCGNRINVQRTMCCSYIS
jgi:hypothetical protein